MRAALLLPLLAILLVSCKSGVDPDFEVELSIDPQDENISKDTIAEELRARLPLLGLKAEVNPDVPGNRIKVRYESTHKDPGDALEAHIDLLVESGRLRVHAIHDDTGILIMEPENIPSGYELMTFVPAPSTGEKPHRYVVQTTEIVSSEHVKSAEVEAGESQNVHISFTVKGGQEMMAATKKMENGRSRLAIIYDEQIISAPVVRGVLDSEIIVGLSSQKQAEAVAISLSQPLSARLLIESNVPLD